MKHCRHPSKLFSNFLSQNALYLATLNKTMSKTMQNMNLFPKKQNKTKMKNQFTFSKHCKKFSFRLEKYNNT